MAVGMRSHGWTISADSSLHVGELFLCIDGLYCHFGSDFSKGWSPPFRENFRTWSRMGFGFEVQISASASIFRP